MEYLALYRKYRPKELDEVVGQSEIKKILASSVKNGTITHAYLFSGPRGTGKTTMAKILAKMVNCMAPVEGNACGKCESCLNILNSNDVIEIDAASNNGVDEIRDLREKANLVPNSAKYKVYIIDEVHMLTTQAFNALLKTLEEPPKHVIFVLATTEYYKIPLTITSRCQKFQFSKISGEEIFDRIKDIAIKEKIKITDDALLEIAKISDGGMRDSINFLDQLRSFSNEMVTIDDVYDVCGNVSEVEILSLLEAISENNVEKVTVFFEKMDEKGKNYTKILENLTFFLKDTILYSKNVNHRYIKTNIESLKEVNRLFNTDEIYIIVDSVNNLLDKIKNVSRQSIVVMTNFLLLMNNISKNNVINKENVEEKVISGDDETKYDMAFQFTSSDGDAQQVDNDVDVNLDVTLKECTEADANDNVSNNREIIVNNTFAVASKESKINLQQLMVKFNDYLTDKKYKLAASSLIDVKVEVAGKGYVIFSAISEAIVEKINNNYKLCAELINLVFESGYNFVVLNQEEWNKYRDEYVTNYKSGKKYELKPLEKEVKNSVRKKKETTIVDKLFELVGEDNIEFK